MPTLNEAHNKCLESFGKETEFLGPLNISEQFEQSPCSPFQWLLFLKLSGSVSSPLYSHHHFLDLWHALLMEVDWRTLFEPLLYSEHNDDDFRSPISPTGSGLFHRIVDPDFALSIFRDDFFQQSHERADAVLNRRSCGAGLLEAQVCLAQ
jgi:hypothetical protein